MDLITAEEARKILDCDTRTLINYRKKGYLRYAGKQKNVTYNLEDVQNLVGVLKTRREKYRPDLVPEEKRKFAKKEDAKPNLFRSEARIPEMTPLKVLSDEELKSLEKDIKNFGDLDEEVTYHIKRVTKKLDDMGMLESTDPMTIQTYALNLKRYIYHFERAEISKESFQKMQVYKKEVTHYEKELGLTTASSLKLIKNESKKAEIVDEMEDLLK